MSDIKTWIERCEEHPDHQSGMISDGMIRARMCEEIADLRAENERLRAEIERLRAEILHLAEWCEMEVPLTHDYMAYRLRKSLEAKP